MMLPPSNKEFGLGTPGGGIAGFLVGALLGAIASLALFLYWFSFPILLLAIVPLVFGVLGHLYGDRFHEWTLRLIRWWS
jgi:hypothetical protein